MGAILNIKKDIKINTGDLNLRIDVDKISADGKVERVVNDMPAKSLVANFGRMMMGAMAQVNVPDGMYFKSSETASGPTMLANFGDSFSTIASVVVGNPTRVNFGASQSHWDNTGNEGLQLMGIGGITPDINGFYDSADATYVSGSAVDINVDTTGSPAFVDEGARVRIFRNASAGSGDEMDMDSTTFGYFRIAVGRGTTANVTDQQSLDNEFDAAESPTVQEPFELVYTDTVVSAPSFNQSTGVGELFFSGIITNNTGASVTINELGLYAAAHRVSLDNRYTLIARDLVSPGITLGQGESAAVTYRIQTALDADGGLLEQFLRVLYRQFDPFAANSTIVDINGANHTFGEDIAFLHSLGIAGEGTNNGLELGFRADQIGLQVGTGNTAVALDDRALETRVDHGEASGELRQYGQIIHDFQISGSTATFKLVKYFENVSGGTINLDEVGLYSVTDEFDGQMYGVVCIWREVLSSTQAVANNEILKVEVTFTVTVV